MQSIVITSGCSGCGTGSITAALGLQMARQGKKVLLAEAVPGLRRMNRLLAVREEGLFDLGDLLEGRCTLSDAVLSTGTAGLTLLQGPLAIDWTPQAAAVQNGTAKNSIVQLCFIQVGAIQARFGKIRACKISSGKVVAR